MRSAQRDRVAIVWAALVAATFVTWWLGSDHPLASESVRIAAGAALAIAFVKVRFIGRYFMDVRSAPVVLRIAFDIWVGGFGAATVLLLLS